MTRRAYALRALLRATLWTTRRILLALGEAEAVAQIDAQTAPRPYPQEPVFIQRGPGVVQ